MDDNQTLTVVTNLRDSNGKLVETMVRKNVALDVVIKAIQELWQTPYEAQLTIRKFIPRGRRMRAKASSVETRVAA